MDYNGIDGPWGSMKAEIDDSAEAAAIISRREILEWRDRHLMAAPLAISRAWQDVSPTIDEKLAAITWRSALTEPELFIARVIDPVIAQAINAAAQQIIVDAQTELQVLIAHQMEVETTMSSTPVERDHLAGAADLIAGLAPLAGGVAAGAALPSLAVVSGTAFFGLVATSAISAPILLGGLLVAGAGIATGALQTAKIKDKRTARMRDRVQRHVGAAVLSIEPRSSNLSVLARLLAAINAAAEAALKRLGHAR